MGIRTSVRTNSDLPGGQAKITKYDKKLSEVLAVATQVFADEGYDRASIRLIAERARFSIAGLYYYVSSKEELLFLVQYRAFDELIAQFKARSEALTDPREKLRLLIRSHLERFLGNMAELVVCSREIDRLVGDYRQQIDDKHREYFTLALRLFQELAARRQQTGVDPRTAALAMFGSINWVHTWYRPETGPSAEQMTEELIRIYLHGVLS
jgi:TetR/AcrR family transcriptional regulator, cholesterol catabolism regulator